MKKKLLILFLYIITNAVLHAQILNISTRQTNALSGSQFVSLVTSMNLTDRENEIFSQVMSGNVPGFMRTLIPVSNTGTINSTSYTVTFYVIPDYLAIGCDTDYFLCPMTPLLAQKICDYTNCTMPTRKMVNAIWSAATVKLSPSSIPPSAQMTTVPIFDQHNTTVWGQRSALLSAHPLGELVGGDKKDVVISNIIYGYPSPGRVVIYGWHYTSGTAIQPLYNGHEETYADYSHGIRLVQMNATINGSPTTINSILTSSTLNSLLSDEGVITTPRYPVAIASAVVPKSFCILNNGEGSVRIKIKNYTENTGCIVSVSNDGNTFNLLPGIYNDTNIVLTGLSNEVISYFKIAGVNVFDTSAFSEVLAVVPSELQNKIIIINGFERATSGNTFDFIIKHGSSVYYCGYLFSSATNEALTDSLVQINDFEITDYILGEESTVDETFSTAEQSIIANYLDNGGKLFVSGAETAWDLDYKGSTTDKSFYNNYLKAQYINDAPNGQSATYYGCSPIGTGFFTPLSAFNFDNGTHGTYNVKYPDVINGINGGNNSFYYTSLSTNFSGIIYSGLFPAGTVQGKLVNMGIPFETIYPSIIRDSLMSKILTYFDPTINTTITASGPTVFCQGDSITLYITQDFGNSYLWYKNGNPLSNDTLNSLAIHQSGTYAVFVSHNGLTALSPFIPVTVNAIPTAQINTNDAIVFCEGESVLLQASTGSGYSWQWLHNSQIIAWAIDSSLTADDSGTYSLITSFNGCSSTDSISLVSNAVPAIPVIIQNGSYLTTGNADSFQWYNENGPINSETQQTFLPQQNGTYYVIVTNSVGCSSRSLDFPYILTQIQESILPYGFGDICFQKETIDFSLMIGSLIEVMDITGNVLISDELPQGRSTVSIIGLSNGIYFIRLFNKTENFCLKFIVSK